MEQLSKEPRITAADMQCSLCDRSWVDCTCNETHDILRSESEYETGKAYPYEALLHPEPNTSERPGIGFYIGLKNAFVLSVIIGLCAYGVWSLLQYIGERWAR